MIAAEIAEYLTASGVGVFDASGVSGDIFLYTLPDTPDECVMIRTTGGSAADGKIATDYPSVQVIVRGTQDPRGAEARAQGIYNLLHGFHAAAFNAGGSYIVNCTGAQSGPAHIGQDSNRRHEFSLNFRLAVKNTNRRI